MTISISFYKNATPFTIKELAKKFKKFGDVYEETYAGILIKSEVPIYGFKKAFRSDGFGNRIVNLIVPPQTQVNFSLDDGGKCRAEQAFVHSIYDIEKKKEVKTAYSGWDTSFKYNKHHIVKPRYSFDETTRSCNSGIHFYLDLRSALDY